MGPYSFGHLQTSEERYRAQLPQQAVWINAADDEGRHWGAVGLHKILRKLGTLSEWIFIDLVKINQLSSKAILFSFFAHVVVSAHSASLNELPVSIVSAFLQKEIGDPVNSVHLAASRVSRLSVAFEPPDKVETKNHFHAKCREREEEEENGWGGRGRGGGWEGG